MAFIRKDLTNMTTSEKKAEIRREMNYRVYEGKSRYHYHIAVELFNTYSFLRDEWYHFPEEHFIKDRFVKKEVLNQQGEEDFPIPPAIVPNYNCGLYLIGITTFNPYTKKEFYWLKVGMSTCLESRLKAYGTHNPCLWKIDFERSISNNVKNKEQKYHQILGLFGTTEDAENSKEWFKVSRADYLAVCQGGFSYLKSLAPCLWLQGVNLALFLPGRRKQSEN